MKTLKYKTLKGLLKQCLHTQITAENLLNKRVYIRGTWHNILLSEEANKEFTEMLANYCVKSKSRANEMADSLKDGYGDFSLFQCFYIELWRNNVYISTSLSGEGFRYCVRTYLKKYC